MVVASAVVIRTTSFITAAVWATENTDDDDDDDDAEEEEEKQTGEATAVPPADGPFQRYHSREYIVPTAPVGRTGERCSAGHASVCCPSSP